LGIVEVNEVQVTVLGSGSSGNGYVINTNGEYLLLECGVHPKEMLKAINFETAKVSGCLCSHAHNDHARYIREYQKYGFPVIMTERSKTDDITPNKEEFIPQARRWTNSPECLIKLGFL
jgi:phosphoribosyl 1,2-cyclic phosphodiesterase